MDLRDLGRGLSYRRLGVLVAGLSRESALARKLSREAAADPGEMSPEDEALAWSLEHHLLAMIVDLLAGANWQRGGGKGSRPQPLPRPGVKPSGERVGGGDSPLTPEQKMRALRAIAPRADEDESEDD